MRPDVERYTGLFYAYKFQNSSSNHPPTGKYLTTNKIINK